MVIQQFSPDMKEEIMTYLKGVEGNVIFGTRGDEAFEEFYEEMDYVYISKDEKGKIDGLISAYDADENGKNFLYDKDATAIIQFIYGNEKISRELEEKMIENLDDEINTLVMRTYDETMKNIFSDYEEKGRYTYANGNLEDINKDIGDKINKDVLIRETRPEDHETVLEIYKTAGKEEPFVDTDIEDQMEFSNIKLVAETDIDVWKTDEKGNTKITGTEKTIAGFSFGSDDEELYSQYFPENVIKKTFYSEWIVVNPIFRREGIYKTLVKKSGEIALEHGKTKRMIDYWDNLSVVEHHQKWYPNVVGEEFILKKQIAK